MSPKIDPGVARIRTKLERAIPNEPTRLAALTLLAYAIENADEERADAWYVRERTHGLSLMAGRLEVCRVSRGRLGLSVLGPIAEDVRTTVGVEAHEGEAWRFIPGGLFLRFPPEKAGIALELLRTPFNEFVDQAMSRVRRVVSLETHVPEAVLYVAEVVGRDLPQPVERLGESLGDEDEDEEQGGDGASREPRVRGRSPIFELGQRSIASLIEAIDPDKGEIALPELQRPFVWEDTKVRELLDSLFIGFPVGTLVLWKTSEDKESRALGAAKKELRATTLVIDGQQRLTSLYAVMRGQELEDKDGSKRSITIAFRPRDGRFEVADAAIRRNPEFLANVTELWKGPRTKSQIRKELLKAVKAGGREVDDAYEEAVEQNIERAHSIIDYRFPTVEIRKTAAAAEASEEDVADIFVRINNQGTRLGQADFVLTLLAVFHASLRDHIETRAVEMSKNAVVGVDTQQVLRMACAVAFGRARMSAVYRFLRGVDPVTGDANPERRAERLKVLDEAAVECLSPTPWRDYMLRVTHAGFVSQGLLASTNAVVNAYAFYILGRRTKVPKQRLDEAVSRWLFGTLLTARYSTSSESRFEEDLKRIHDLGSGNPDVFIRSMDEVLEGTITGDFWTRTLPAEFDTQRSRSPVALAFRAAQVVLGARGLFSDQTLQNLLAPPGKGGRAASEMHHLFPKAWLQQAGITDRRRINQVANLADVGWYENNSVGKQGPSQYVPLLRQKMHIDDDRWGRMCAEHALPLGWESMKYDEFLLARRERMSEVIRIAYRKLGGEADGTALTPPWFLPGAEVVWKSIGDVERSLRSVTREIYAKKFGTEAGRAIEEALPDLEREVVSRAMRSRPSTADPLGIIDYLYLGQLPVLLFKQGVLPETQAFFGKVVELKKRLNDAVGQIAPVRNEIAHVREVSPERLQRANLACADIARLIPGR